MALLLANGTYLCARCLHHLSRRYYTPRITHIDTTRHYITTFSPIRASKPTTYFHLPLLRPSIKPLLDIANSPYDFPTRHLHHLAHDNTLLNFNQYWETLRPSRELLAQSNQFFTKNCKPQILTSVTKFRDFLSTEVPEVAFVGRSNVGKSSLLNALLNLDLESALARTSRAPGCTRTMNSYGIGPMHFGGVKKKRGSDGFKTIIGREGVTIVDLPGYGEGSVAEWGYEIMKYLSKRKELRRVFVLVDSLHGLKGTDLALLASLRQNGIPHQVILSKLDKVYIPNGTRITRKTTRNGIKGSSNVTPRGTKKDLGKIMANVKTQIKPKGEAGALGELLACSSEILVNGQHLGMDSVRYAVLQAVGYPFNPLRKVHHTIIRKTKGDDSGVTHPLTLRISQEGNKNDFINW